MMAVEPGFFSLLSAPDFVSHRIVNHSGNDFALEANAIDTQKCGMPVEIIHRAIQRIDHPLVFARLVAHNSFFAVKGVMRKLFKK